MSKSFLQSVMRNLCLTYHVFGGFFLPEAASIVLEICLFIINILIKTHSNLPFILKGCMRELSSIYVSSSRRTKNRKAGVKSNGIIYELPQAANSSERADNTTNHQNDSGKVIVALQSYREQARENKGDQRATGASYQIQNVAQVG